jgi:hypothetical protein
MVRATERFPTDGINTVGNTSHHSGKPFAMYLTSTNLAPSPGSGAQRKSLGRTNFPLRKR